MEDPAVIAETSARFMASQVASLVGDAPWSDGALAAAVDSAAERFEDHLRGDLEDQGKDEQTTELIVAAASPAFRRTFRTALLGKTGTAGEA